MCNYLITCMLLAQNVCHLFLIIFVDLCTYSNTNPTEAWDVWKKKVSTWPALFELCAQWTTSGLNPHPTSFEDSWAISNGYLPLFQLLNVFKNALGNQARKDPPTTSLPQLYTPTSVKEVWNTVHSHSSSPPPLEWIGMALILRFSSLTYQFRLSTLQATLSFFT